ncbi:MAG: hypothetical protein MZV65_35705 [Chromatiales bacterium]|nr:hypothetical protein [Chromatiales bacterium]
MSFEVESSKAAAPRYYPVAQVLFTSAPAGLGEQCKLARGARRRTRGPVAE